MPLQIFPEPSQSTVNSFTVEIPSSKKYKKYKLLKKFDAGVYSITTSPNTSNATISFFDSDEAIVLTTATTSGALTYSLASEKPGAYIDIDSDASTLVIFELTSINLVSNSLSGTVDTLTTTGTYNQTGKLYVLAVGGGAAGQCGFGGSGNFAGGRGGKGGASTSSIVYTNTATSVTVGAGGNLNSAQQNRTAGSVGNSGGATSFGNLVTASGGLTETGSSGSPTASQPQIINYALDVYAGNNGGGGAGAGADIYPGSTSGAVGTGSGIGTGGSGGTFYLSNQNSRPLQDATAATGKGAGGGGGGGSENGGGPFGKATAGTEGVIYVLRGF